jgi:hypothetical protein
MANAPGIFCLLSFTHITRRVRARGVGRRLLGAKRSSWSSAAPPVEGTIHTHGSSRADGPGAEKMVNGLYEIESAVVSRVKQIPESK